MIFVDVPEQSIRVGVLDIPGIEPSTMPRVFFHGLGSSSIDTFAEIVRKPSMRSARSVLIDLPGFGHSTAPHSWSCSMDAHAAIVRTVLEKLELARIDLIGHSMGGSVAISFAWQHPELVNRLVVAEPTFDPGVGDLSVHIARQTEARFLERGYEALVFQTQRQAARGDLLAARFLETVTRTSPLALHRSAVSLLTDRDPTFRAQFESLRTPRATITGDRTTPLAPPLADPDITHYLVKDAAHVMMIDNPDGFADAVSGALRR